MRAGRASSVTDLGDGTILRVGGRPAIEAASMEVAQRHGFPVPRVIEVREDALVLERIDGQTMGERLIRRPWEGARQAATLAELHERLHQIRFEGATLVHFDLHPDNVILAPGGPVVVDWTNAHAGEADADVAMTWVILATSAGPLGRVLASLFRRRVGRPAIQRGLAGAHAFRLEDPHVSAAEKRRVRRARP